MCSQLDHGETAMLLHHLSFVQRFSFAFCDKCVRLCLHIRMEIIVVVIVVGGDAGATATAMS